MKKLLLLVALMIGFMSFTPVEKGDQLKTSPMVEDVTIEQSDVFVAPMADLTIYQDIPFEVGYAVILTDTKPEEATGPQSVILCNYNLEMPVDIEQENRYWQNESLHSYTYNSTGYPFDKSDNFTRWLIYYPERSSLPHDIS